MIQIVLASILALATPNASGGSDTDTDQVAPQSPPTAMAPEIARARITQAIDEKNMPADRVKILNEVVERCDDHRLVALAQFNLGTTLMDGIKEKPDQIGPVIDAFQAADRGTTDHQIQSESRFNLGHAYYLSAQGIKEDTSKDKPGDLQSAIDLLKAKVAKLKPAASAFRSVMEVDPHNTRAAANVERIRNEMKQLQDQIDELEKMLKQQQDQQKKQQQQQQKQQQDAADKLKKLGDQQQKQADNTSSSPPQDDQQRQEQQLDQQKLNDQTDAAKNEIAKQQQETDQIQKKLDDARKAQKRAQEAMMQGDQEQAAKEQKKAADSIKEAAKAMQEKADQSKKQGENKDKGEQQSSQKQPDQDRKGQQDAQQQRDAENKPDDAISEIAKQLLDKERREREARQVYRATGRPTKVDKDW